VAENWVNTGALLERMNFALALVNNRIPGTRVDLARLLGEQNRDVHRQRKATRSIRWSDCGREMSARTRETLLKQLTDQITIPPMSRRRRHRTQHRRILSRLVFREEI
jgi:hypothetical protein